MDCYQYYVFSLAYQNLTLPYDSEGTYFYLNVILQKFVLIWSISGGLLAFKLDALCY